MSGPRYSIIPGDAVTDIRLEGRDLQVLALLGTHTDNHGWCSRSQVKMGRQLHCARSTIQRSLARLIECGYLQQRSLLRENGGDRAHEYRVLLDDVRPAEFINDIDGSPAADAASSAEGEASSGEAAPLPTGGHPPAHRWAPLPAQDGQGVPSHGWAPNRTTLPERSERETRARRDPEAERQAAVVAAEADAAFMAWFSTWPTAGSDPIDRTHKAWLALSPVERTEAVERSAAAVAHHTVTLKRSGCYAAVTYLVERRWKRLPTSGGSAAKPGSDIIAVPPRGQMWFAIFWRRWAAGEPVKVMFDAMLHGRGCSARVADLPAEAELARLVKIEVAEGGKATAEMAAWKEALEPARISFTPFDIRMPFVWVPSRWPPGWDDRGRSDDSREEVAF